MKMPTESTSQMAEGERKGEVRLFVISLTYSTQLFVVVTIVQLRRFHHTLLVEAAFTHSITRYTECYS